MAKAPSAPSPQQSAMQAIQLNQMARQAILSNCIKMKQQIMSVSVNPASQKTISVTNNNMRNVGLLLGFVIEVEGVIKNTAAGALTRTPLGTSNVLSQVQFDDLSNYTRVKVPGWYLGFLNTVRHGYAYGGVYPNGLPMGYGDNFDVFSGPPTVAADASAEVKHTYFQPIAYSDNDLRGAIFMQTVSATANLQIDLNTAPCVAAAGNPLSAIYSGNAAAGWDGPVTVKVYQIYLDQIPRLENGQYVLPTQDLNTVYDLKQTTFTGMTPGQEFPMPYSNYRAFLSTTALFDNGGQFNGGEDVNHFSLVSANFTRLWQLPPSLLALEARTKIMTDPPKGMYHIESRNIPVNTINFGNMELNVQAKTVNPNARMLVGYESFSLINQLVGASSLAGG